MLQLVKLFMLFVIFVSFPLVLRQFPQNLPEIRSRTVERQQFSQKQSFKKPCSRMFVDVRGMFVDVRGRAWTCVDVRGARRGRSWMFVETPKLPSNCQWTCAIRNQSKLLGYYSNEPKNMKTEPNHKLNAQTRTISSAHCLLSSKLIALCEFSPCCLVCPPHPDKTDL
jgi:hypothetical protein